MKMNYNFSLILFFALLVRGFSLAQELVTIDYSKWTILTPGIDYIEQAAPLRSKIGDSKLSILRIDPLQFQFEIHAATNYDSISRDVYKWADSFKLNIVFNASMYDLRKPLVSRGYLKVGDHFNNSQLLPGWNSMIAVKNSQNMEQEIAILDLTCNKWESEKDNYFSFAQGIRMLDSNGNPMNWGKVQSCSMLVAAEDPSGRFYLIFCRSPYTQNEMIQFMRQMPYKLRNGIYLEGGPETSLLIDINEHCIEKIGSWVSKVWEKDSNKNFWPLPNVIGVKFR